MSIHETAKDAHQEQDMEVCEPNKSMTPDNQNRVSDEDDWVDLLQEQDDNSITDKENMEANRIFEKSARKLTEAGEKAARNNKSLKSSMKHQSEKVRF